MADLIAWLDAAAHRLAALALALPGAHALPQRDWLAHAQATGALRRPLAWRNTLLATASLRHLHVEFFALPGEIGVLHLCAFPRLDLALPILGFDVIAGRERATGCFLDFSPTVPGAEPVIDAWAEGLAAPRAGLGETRVLPEWTAIFSSRVVAVRPGGPAQFQAALELGEASLLALAGAHAAPADPAAMRAAQQRYMDAQRRNERTRRMLAGCIGPDLADAFIAQCLFPDVVAPTPAAQPAEA